jgi:hypothetical protein
MKSYTSHLDSLPARSSRVLPLCSHTPSKANCPGIGLVINVDVLNESPANSRDALRQFAHHCFQPGACWSVCFESGDKHCMPALRRRGAILRRGNSRRRTHVHARGLRSRPSRHQRWAWLDIAESPREIIICGIHPLTGFVVTPRATAPQIEAIISPAKIILARRPRNLYSGALNILHDSRPPLHPGLREAVNPGPVSL